MFTQLYGFETVTTRYFNVFGPRQDPGSPYSGVISLFSTAILEGRQPVIYGDGEQTRDFTYVANVVDGVLRACEAPKAAGEVINVATGGRISLNELLRVMNQICGTNIQPTYQDPRVGDVRDSQADISKARALLGYEPIASFEEGLRHTLDVVPHRKRRSRAADPIVRCRTSLIQPASKPQVRPRPAARRNQPSELREAIRRSLVYASSIPIAVAMMTGPSTRPTKPNAPMPPSRLTNTSNPFN